MNTSRRPMPQYRSRTVAFVSAVQIKSILTQPNGAVLIVPTESEIDNIVTTAAWVEVNGPEVGGYYAVGSNGRATAISRDDFERCYVRDL